MHTPEQNQSIGGYVGGYAFSASMLIERLDWIGRKLDGQEMTTPYQDIIDRDLEHQEKISDPMAALARAMACSNLTNRENH